jgi:ATP-dependent Clp protease protease subunit
MKIRPDFYHLDDDDDEEAEGAKEQGATSSFM